MTYALNEALAGASAARSFMTAQGIRGAWTNAVLVERALARGLEVAPDKRRRVLVRSGKRARWFNAGSTNFNRPMAIRCTRFKEVTSALLRARGIAAPRNAVFQSDEAELAWRWAEALLPIVLKPSNGNQGRQVHVHITDRASFHEAFEEIAQTGGRVLVEEFVQGVEHRVLVVNYRVAAVTRRVPANVVGNGKSDIAQLVEEKNVTRTDDPIHQKLKIDQTALRELRRGGVSPESVPERGEVIHLRSTSNIHTGGDAVDATDELSRDEISYVERAARVFNGLRLGGFDVLLPRGTLGTEPCLLEINASPMLSMHHFPVEGKPRDAAGRLLDAMFPATAA